MAITLKQNRHLTKKSNLCIEIPLGEAPGYQNKWKSVGSLYEVANINHHLLQVSNIAIHMYPALQFMQAKKFTEILRLKNFQITI